MYIVVPMAPYVISPLFNSSSVLTPASHGHSIAAARPVKAVVIVVIGIVRLADWAIPRLKYA